MADLSDVQNALVALAAQVLYPNGTAQPSLPGVPIRIYAGWPQANGLDADLLAGTCHLTVFTTPGGERNTTRYSRDWQQAAVVAATLTLTVNGQTVTVGGTVAAGQNLAVVADGQPYVYAVQANDTLASIATALAALIAGGIPGTTSSGAIVTLPGSAVIDAARVGTTGTLIQELRRQERLFQITVWADTPAHRDAIVQPLDAALAALAFLTLADGTAGRLIYKGSQMIDAFQKDKLYRRDLSYQVEYPTTQTTAATEIITEQASLGAQDGTGAAVTTTTVNL